MLPIEFLRQISIELAEYSADQCRSAIMGALHITQAEKGWLAPETIAFVADYIGIMPAQAYEVATFYNIYNLKPVGKYKLIVYTSLPCALRDGMDTGEYLKEKLGIDYGGTTPDGKFTLAGGECMGAYDNAPVMLINNHSMCSFTTEEAIEKELAGLK